MNQIRLNIQARLQFLSFVYSTLGSPRDFELTRQHVEILWDSLIKFNDFTQTNSPKQIVYKKTANSSKNKAVEHHKCLGN